MAGNTIGKLFTLTTFGESHGIAIGGVIDGCPSNIKLDFEFIQNELDRRKPAQSNIVSQRKESDKVTFLSGIFEGKTTGAPIGFIIYNENQKPNDYEHLKDVYRPSHADYTYQQKYGIRDYNGGGRSSARETACRVVAGAIAKLILKNKGITITAYVSQVGQIKVLNNYLNLNLNEIETTEIRCPELETAQKMIDLIKSIKKEGDTIGGCVSAVIKGVPSGLGEPVFDKLHAELGKAMLSINAAKGFEIGSGFNSVNYKGSELNDVFINENNSIKTKTNNSGGIQGGISNGEDIYFNVAFKPVATLMQKQKSVNVLGEGIIIDGKGRHDPCVLPRAVPIVEAMAALVILDFVLIHNAKK
ncbi:MAG: chorismate synthase [Bacteroidetes bacterium]|nr:chorismate synthase [Bacteroidota bacterium]